MAINPISSNNTPMSTSPSAVSLTDTETKTIQNEIINKNQRLNRVTSDAKMSAEEKAKERREIQKQIDELNRKLELLRMEQKEKAKKAQKEQEEKAVVAQRQTEEISSKEKKEIIPEDISKEDSKKEEELKKEASKEQIENLSIHPQDIQKLLESSTVLQKEQIIHNTQRQKDSAENILASEIKSDKIYGTDTSDKREKLSSMIKQPVPKVQIEEKKEPTPVQKNMFSGKIVISDNIL